MKIRDLYKDILHAVGAVVSDDDLISMTRPDDDPIPFVVDDKRLALPSDRLLNQGAFNEDTGYIAFHPMCENVVLDPSPVFEKLQTAMAFRLTWVLRELLVQLVAIAADSKQHRKMKIGAHGLLSAMPDADKRTLTDLTKIFEGTSTVGAKKLINLYVRMGGVYEGAKVNRLGRFFPSIVDGLDLEKSTLNGVNLRKADVPAFLALIEYVLPEYKDNDRYSAPSNSLVAPSFHALVKAYYKVANQLNKIVDIHADHLENADALKIPTDWFEHVQDLSVYRDHIPVLPGNDGASGTKNQRVSATAQPMQHSGPAQPARPAPSSGGKGVSVGDALAAMTRPPQQRQPQAGRWGSAVAQRDNEADLPPWARKQEEQTGWGNRGSSGGGRRSDSGRL